MFISDNSETISALNLVNLIKNKEISPVEVIENTIKSIGMKDTALFRQQVYINGKWED